MSINKERDMTKFNLMKGLFGLLPTPYTDDLEIFTDDLKRVANFCCESGQHGIVWPVMVGEYYFLGEYERIKNLDAVLEEINGRLPLIFGCSGVSIPQSVIYAKAAQKANADAVIAMAPSASGARLTMDMFRRMAEVFEGPIFIQNAGGHSPLSGEQIAKLIDDVPSIQYVKEERDPAPPNIADVQRMAGHKLKTIFGGSGGKHIPAEISRGANGCMPACELGDILAKIFELWWAGKETEARDLHTRVLPLINLENHPFMRYMLKRRGVFTSLVERAPARQLDEGDKHEISILLKAVENEITRFPFGAE
jgi:dihydrodipicolinate synthase/N-acetylneuraminate lyase